MAEEEQQNNNDDYISDAFSYTQEDRRERKQNRKNHVIKAYNLYYVAQNLNEAPGEANRVDEGYWCLKKYEMQTVSLRKPTGSWIVLPTAMHQTVTKVPVEYSTPTESILVETLTGSFGTASPSSFLAAAAAAQSSNAGGAIIKRKNPFETDGNYHFDYDTDPHSSKLKEEAESEGFEMIPTAITSNSSKISGSSSSIIPTLFKMGKQKKLFDDNSQLFEDLVLNRLFSEVHPVESNPQDGSTTQRMFHAFVPRHGGEQELPAGLLPDENERKSRRMLQEIGSQLQRMKEEDARAAAQLEQEKIRLEREYQKKMAEITSRLRRGTIEEMSQGTVYNAETVFEEQGQGEEEEKT